MDRVEVVGDKGLAQERPVADLIVEGDSAMDWARILRHGSEDRLPARRYPVRPLSLSPSPWGTP